MQRPQRQVRSLWGLYLAALVCLLSVVRARLPGTNPGACRALPG
jgi:hypothetical protein